MAQTYRPCPNVDAEDRLRSWRGGHEQSNFATSYDWIDYYETKNGKWYLVDEMAFLDAPHPRDHTGGALVRGRICVAAGQNGGTVDWPIVPQTDCFDHVAEIWNKPRLQRYHLTTSRKNSSAVWSSDGHGLWSRLDNRNWERWTKMNDKSQGSDRR
jgi:hypothetical protein